MRLGNVGGKNKGKKYLKITGNETITPENRAKAETLNHWFSNNYQRLQSELVSQRTYNEDILNETFVRIHQKVLYGGLEIADYKSYFHRAFYTNYIQNSMKDAEMQRYHVPDDFATEALDNALEEKEIIQEKRQLYRDVLSFVKEKFAPTEYLIYTSYINLEDRKYETVSETTDNSLDKVARVIRKIKKSIQKNDQLMRVRQSM